MNKIRFCGQQVTNKEFVYGNGIIEVEQKVYLLDYISGEYEETEVIPASVKQLVCFDDNYAEVYEDDIVEDEEKNIYQARMIKTFSDMSADKFVPAWKPKKIFLKDK